MEGRKPKALSSVVIRDDPSKQMTITAVFQANNIPESSGSTKVMGVSASLINSGAEHGGSDTRTMMGGGIQSKNTTKRAATSGNSIKRHFTLINNSESTPKRAKTNPQAASSWSCRACTFQNDKPLGLVCSICETPRYS